MVDLNFVIQRHSWQFDHYSDPPLGLLSVASQSRKYGANVSLTDLGHDTKFPKADIYAFTATTMEVPWAIKRAFEIKIFILKVRLLLEDPTMTSKPKKIYIGI